MKQPAVALSIRIPPALYEQIKKQAGAEQRTINGQIIFLLMQPVPGMGAGDRCGGWTAKELP